MGYYIQAIASTQSALESRATDFSSAVVVPLASGLALVPLTAELLDEIGASGASGQFEKFTPAVAYWLRTVSDSAPAAYIEAEFFGGIGSQSATVWERGEQILAPFHDRDAINIALRLFHISRGAFRDEFEAVGLPRHRNTDDWLADAIPKNSSASSETGISDHR